MQTYKVLMLMLHFIPTLCIQYETFSTITPNHSIQGNQTLVSSAGTFEAGFFNFANSQIQYFGIWYKTISPRIYVWIANRDSPIQNSKPILKLTYQGTLTIFDDSSPRSIIWYSNASTIVAKPVLSLFDSGNLVVKDGEKILWESFDYPGDTFLAGMKLKTNLLNGPYRSLTSWKSVEDPSLGEFSYHIDFHGFPQLVTTKGENLYSRGGAWNGYAFGGVSWLRNLKLFNFSLVFTDKEVSYEYETLQKETITRLWLSPSGSSQRLVWSERRKDWDTISTRPMDSCAYYSICGANSICNITNSPRICKCLEGFVPKYYEKWNSLDWSGGCVRRIRLNCIGDEFLKHSGVELPDTSSSWFNKSLSLEECEKMCLKNCSCTAYASLDIKSNSGCLLWLGKIWDLTKHIDQGQDIFIRLAASDSELDHRRNRWSINNKKLAVALVGIILFIMILGLATFTYIKRKKIAKTGMVRIFYGKQKREREDVQLSTIFGFSTISNATNRFSDDNKIGQGGFGPVYKGVLEDGLEIAVKRLSKTSEQGEEQFKNEVMLMAKLQHRNLVKLLGCSIYQNEKLLIYELMPNRSLDYFIFDSTRKKQLDLMKRFQIIDGIARDFGMARTFRGDQDKSNTKRLMGTYGYMPPEYAVHGCFSIKSDVFSFGVIVLEIISGRRIRNFYDLHHHLNLLGHAWKLWNEEKAQELIDDLFHGTIIPCEILRCIHVGLLCVQQIPEHRPNMSSVVLMLNGEKLLPDPSQPGFYTSTAHLPIQVESSSRSCGDCSQNEASVSLLEAR
ncbi:G-type lectin S-receptor serine/threonine-protein kinase [Trifolium repens]|nr:G-type lectin S-receptor serine/threonine-protein kinase [Trifolium repens]